jgi:hypothetical protein
MFICLEINARMMNKCTGYWLDNFVTTTHLQDSLPKFISMDNNLTATIIIIWMDQINGTQYVQN